MTRRLFIALALPDEVKAELARTREQLASRRDRINWVRDGQLHLTLRFLGETEDRLVPDLERVLEQLAKDHAAPALRLGEPGIFGPPSAPRVLWVGLKGATRDLEALAGSLEKQLRRLGLPPSEHGFKAHLTIGRVKSCRDDLAAAHLRHPPLPLPMRLRELLLIESRLRPEGAEHHVLTRHILGTEASTA
ncbi:MAG: RNA 2',3'-cyclic phosphodiesterase [bacterium]|nr:RNA 2',3'-cyclic phosphodiesterase [bacterium]